MKEPIHQTTKESRWERRQIRKGRLIPQNVEKGQWINRFTDEEVDDIMHIIEKYAAFSSPDHIEEDEALDMLCTKGLTKDEAKFEIKTAR